MRIHKLDFRYRVLFYVALLPFSLVVTIHCTLLFMGMKYSSYSTELNREVIVR
jgi:hypothetical protein